MEALLIKIAASKKHTASLKVISHISSAIIALVFLFQIGFSLYRTEYFTAVKIAVSAAVGYVMVTVMRRIINAPRPYELRSYYKDVPKNKSGESFPSRHAYSAFVISTLAWLLNPIVSISCAVMSVCLCLSRVLVGIHFGRDVVCGAIIGILAGAVGILVVIL